MVAPSGSICWAVTRHAHAQVDTQRWALTWHARARVDTQRKHTGATHWKPLEWLPTASSRHTCDRTVEEFNVAPRMARVGPGHRATWAAGRRLVSRAAFAKVPPRQGRLRQEGHTYCWGNTNNLRYADDTTLMAEGEEELKSHLMKVKEESGKVGLKLNIQKTKIVAPGPITSWEIDGETV